MSSLIGRTLSRYQIIDEVSRGGMGVVYRALDVRLNREVALKVLPPDLVADPDRRQRFVQEARAASAIEHPHIAVIHEIDDVDGVSFIAMELVRGEQLSAVTARGPLPADRALEIAGEIAEGLARAHEKNVVHRDLKPANVMLTEDGHAKVIDFGLAKLVDALSGDGGGETVVRAETEPGMVMGTVTYMSPEQARSGKVDHRSDIFSFGILLHEMLTGRPPFRGNTGIDTMHAILHAPVPPLPALGPAVTPEATADVQRLLEKCLAKDPADRYQGMRDVVVDLRAARRRLESSGTSAVRPAVVAAATRQGFLRWRGYVFAGAAVVVAGLALWVFMGSRQGAAPAADGGKPSVAVLYFENNTGNPQLDWMRTGLTDMIVTDLSQSPDVEVLGTDRLVQILGQMKRQDDRQISFETVQEVARRAGVKSVILGSYVKAGDTIRINVKLQEAGTGRIVTAERVEAASESTLFTTVDDLTRRIKNKFLPGNADPTKALLSSRISTTDTTTALSMDRDLKDVSTSSIEAYRYYVEGIDLHNRDKDRDAVPLLEKAIAVDPTFALALAKLAVIESNLAHPIKRDEYAKRALEHLDRLTARERYYIEGVANQSRRETFGKAIDAYKKAVDLYPDHAGARHNLAVLYSQTGRDAEAIALYEELRRRGTGFPVTYTNLSGIYVRLGQYDKANEVLQEYVRANPSVPRGHLGLGNLFAAWGRWDQSLASFDRAQAIDPNNPLPQQNRRAVLIVTERWADLDAVNQKLLQMNDPTQKFQALMGQANAQLYKGRSTDAQRIYEAAAASVGPRGTQQSANARLQIATLFLDKGQPTTALVSAQRAVADSNGQAGLFAVLRIHTRLGHTAEAAKARAEVERLRDAAPETDDARRLTEHRQAGQLARDRRDNATAIQELKQAEALEQPGQFAAGPAFELGSAYLESGNDTEAAARFERIVNAGVRRANNPVQFVRSLYFLGQISERKGDRAKARGYYERFVQYWGDGEMDRERVADARKKLAAS